MKRTAHYFGSFEAFVCPFQRAQNKQHYNSARVELSDHDQVCLQSWQDYADLNSRSEKLHSPDLTDSCYGRTQIQGF